MHQWTWAVSYDDGATFAHEEALGGFANVRVPEVTTLIVYDRDEPTRRFVVVLRDDARPIFFRRKRQIVPLDGGPQSGHVAAVAFGWQKTVNGANVKSLSWLLPDGSLAITDRDLDDL